MQIKRSQGFTIDYGGIVNFQTIMRKIFLKDFGSSIIAHQEFTVETIGLQLFEGLIQFFGDPKSTNHKIDMEDINHMGMFKLCIKKVHQEVVIYLMATIGTSYLEQQPKC